MTLSTKAAATAAVGLVLGGLGSFVFVNILSYKQGLDVFSSHDNSNFYCLDGLSAVACATFGYVMASFCERRYVSDAELQQHLQGGPEMGGSDFPSATVV